MEKGKAIKLSRPSSDRGATLSFDPVSRVTTGRKGLQLAPRAIVLMKALSSTPTFAPACLLP